MKVLITGGGGFIGSHLVDSQLGRGYSVRTVDRHVERLAHVADHPRLEVVTGDITDADLVTQLVDGVDNIYHLASAHLEISVPDSRYWAVNVAATESLLRAALGAGVKRVVHCSSVGVFGQLANLPADETAPCNPTNIYEQTKLVGERAALRFSQQSGLAVVVARPAWVYGQRCPRTRKLLRTMRKRRFVVVGDGKTLRHPIYVQDAVKGLELCAEADSAIGQVYILAGATPVSIATLIQTIAEIVRVPPPTIRVPILPAKALGFAFQWAFKPLGHEPPFSRRSVDFFLKDNAYDIGKAQRELGFQPEIDLREGLAKTWHWLNKQEGQI